MLSSIVWKSSATVIALGCLAAAPTVAAASTHPGSPQDTVYVIQGVPRSSVDVTVDGRTVKRAVQPKAVVGPLNLTAGRHMITFSTTGWKVSSVVTISHRSSDVVLHWPADLANKPVVTVFGNDLAPVGMDKGRLTVAHTAVVPPADVRVDKKVLFANIANGEFVTAEVPGGTYSVDVVPTGQTTNPLLGPVMLPVKPGVLTRVFAIGQPSNGSMDAVVQVLPLAKSGSPSPGSVNAGSAGLVATSTSPADTRPGATSLALVVGALTLLGTLFALARRRLTTQ